MESAGQDEQADGARRWDEDLKIEAFVVQIRVHPPHSPNRHGVWRGTVTRVSDRTRIPIHDLGQIVPFIASCLEPLNARQSFRTWLIRRLY